MSSMHLSQVRKWVLNSPPVEWGLNNIRELLIGSVKQGPVPQHVAFVMDGNRRFARSHKIETVEGHNLGFEALARVCNKYLQLYIHGLTIGRFLKCVISPA
jgi:ditrans,polycis-polyprenyl diphosphate synthase